MEPEKSLISSLKNYHHTFHHSHPTCQSFQAYGVPHVILP